MRIWERIECEARAAEKTAVDNVWEVNRVMAYALRLGYGLGALYIMGKCKDAIGAKKRSEMRIDVLENGVKQIADHCLETTKELANAVDTIGKLQTKISYLGSK